MEMKRVRRSIYAATAFFASVATALAQEAESAPGGMHIGKPLPWQMDLQEAASPIQAQIQWFNDYVLAFIIPTTILVAALLAWCIWRYRASRNPVASRTAHNTAIEVAWTITPVIVLLFIAIPSFQLLTAQYNPPREPELTVKAVGYQWYWGYEYQPSETAEEGESPLAPVSVISYPIGDGDRESYGKTDENLYPDLLAVDNEMVVPVDTVVRVLSTSADVIHSFAVPSLGVKVDAVPGRINEYWFEANREGLFYGQCSELCGQNHYFMPIAVRVVSKEQFENWYAMASESVEDANALLTAAIEAEKRGVEVAGR